MTIGILITCWSKRVNQALVNLELVKFYNPDAEYKVVFVENGYIDSKYNDIINNDFPEIETILYNKDNPGLQQGELRAIKQGLKILESLNIDTTIKLGARTWILKKDWVKNSCNELDENNPLVLAPVDVNLRKNKGIETGCFVGNTKELNNIFSKLVVNKWIEYDLFELLKEQQINYKNNLWDFTGVVNHGYDTDEILKQAILDGCDSFYVNNFNKDTIEL